MAAASGTLQKVTIEAVTVLCCVRNKQDTLLFSVNSLVSIWCRILERDISETVRAVKVKFHHSMDIEVITLL